MEEKLEFITSALPYVNNVLHLGNIIGSILGGDVHARFMRKCGKKVLYLCGTDEYGTTTEIKATQEGLTCQQICDKYYALQTDALKFFNISFNVWGRTTTETQTEMAQDIFLRLWRNGCLEEQIVPQLWCTPCDMYIADRYVNGVCYHLVDGIMCKGIIKGDQCDACGNLIDLAKVQKKWCSMCKKEPASVLSKHLFLKLDMFKDALNDYFFGLSAPIMSSIAKAITASWLSNPLENRCITRDLKWGTPVPKAEGLEEYWDKVFYVWFDAPIGYLSILKHGRPDDWQDWLKGNWTQFMAKDNVPFHTVIFPATLMGSKFESSMVTHLPATDYLSFEKHKFSKSEGTGIFCDTVQRISEKLNIDEDYWRYYLLKIRPESHDSSFTLNGFVTAIKGELAQKIGNLVNRCVSLGQKMYTVQSSIPYDFTSPTQSPYFDKMMQVFTACIDHYHNFEYIEVTKCINRMAEIGNEYIDIMKLWNTLKAAPDENSYYLGNTMAICWLLAEICEPCMPKKSSQIKQHMNIKTTGFFENIKDVFSLKKGIVDVSYENYKILFNQVKLEDLQNALQT